KGARSVLESAGLPVLGSELSSRVAYQEALASGLGITTYAPRDAGTREIFDLLDELERMFHGQKARGRFATQAAAG
ncbi:MAG TPA: chromosome partitioning protein ParA, partial [Polyangiaceae bacterium]